MKVDEYIAREEERLNRSRSNLERAHRLAHNLRAVRELSDRALIICASNERSASIHLADPCSSEDPVYRKISLASAKALKPDYANPYYSLSPYIREHVNRLQMKIEARRMGEGEYRALEAASIEGLLETWSKTLPRALKE